MPYPAKLPKSGCSPVLAPIWLMMLFELGSTGRAETSTFHTLSAGKILQLGALGIGANGSGACARVAIPKSGNINSSAHVLLILRKSCVKDRGEIRLYVASGAEPTAGVARKAAYLGQRGSSSILAPRMKSLSVRPSILCVQMVTVTLPQRSKISG